MVGVGTEREPPVSVLERAESVEHVTVLKLHQRKEASKLDLPEQGEGETPSPISHEMMEFQRGSVPCCCCC